MINDFPLHHAFFKQFLCTGFPLSHFAFQAKNEDLPKTHGDRKACTSAMGNCNLQRRAETNQLVLVICISSILSSFSTLPQTSSELGLNVTSYLSDLTHRRVAIVQVSQGRFYLSSTIDRSPHLLDVSLSLQTLTASFDPLSWTPVPSLRIVVKSDARSAIV